MEIRYIVNEDDERVGVILDIEEHERMVEELEDSRAADEVRAAIARGEDEFIPYEQAREEIARGRPRNGELPALHAPERQQTHGEASQ